MSPQWQSNNNKSNNNDLHSIKSQHFGVKGLHLRAVPTNVLRISRYSDFLWVMLINTGIFLRG